MLVTAIATPAAFAHGGHGDPQWASTILHQLLEPEHAIPAMLGAAVLVFAGVAARRKRERAAGR